MKCLTNLTLSIYFLFVYGLVQAQPSENALTKKHSIAALKEDFNILRQSLEETHAGLYAYTSKKEMDATFDSIESSLNKPMTSIDFYRRVIPLNSIIKNNHTKFSPPKSYEEAIDKTLPRFPFEVYWNQNKLFVVQNNSRDISIKEGSVIQSINGERAEDVFDELVSNSRRDGYNRTGVENEISASFSKFYAYFKGTPSFFQMELLSPDGASKTANIEAITFEEVKEHKFKRYNDDGKNWVEKKLPILELAIEGDIATLKLRQFYNPYRVKSGQKLANLFDKYFAEIEKAGVKHLIIDIRNNRGGNEYRLMDLFSHLYAKPFMLYKEKITSFKKIPNAKYYEENITARNLYLPLILKKKGEVYHVNKLGLLNGYSAGLHKKKPANTVYRGDVYLLTNGISFSASGFMAGLVKNYNRGLVIGEEAGGNSSQCVAGDVIRLKLPNTNISIKMPLILLKLDVDFENTGHGVIPDYVIKPNIDDILAEKDVVMDFTFKLIEEKKQKIKSK